MSIGNFSVFQNVKRGKIMKSLSIGAILLIAAAAVLLGTASRNMDKPCGTNTGTMSILVIGSDGEAHHTPPGADLIRLVDVDFDQNRVSVRALTRDLWVQTAILNDLNVEATSLGRVYDYRFDATRQGNSKNDNPSEYEKKAAAGAQAVAQVIADDFGLTSQNYLVIDMDQLPEMIDTIGGIPVSIPSRLETGTYTFEAGDQVLNGEQIAAYVRYLEDPSADPARIGRQNAVLFGLRSTLADPSTIARLPGLYKGFRKSIATDLKPNQITDLICVLNTVPPDQIVLTSVN
jgi:LCP family protein required for cell wall assembly